MYTRCPTCSTCFRVTDRHLAIAKGKVRCGKCQFVFNAPEHAIEDLPATPAATKPSPTPAVPPMAKTAAEKAKEQIQKNKPAKTVTATPPGTPKLAEKEAPHATEAPIFKADATMVANIDDLHEGKLSKIDLDAPAEIKNNIHNQKDEDDIFDDNFDLNAAIDELTGNTEDKNEVNKNTQQHTPDKNHNKDVFDTDAYDATNASSVADIMDEMEGQLSLNIPVPSEKEEYNVDNEFDFLELDSEAKSSNKKTKTSNQSKTEAEKNFLDIDKADDFIIDDEFLFAEEDEIENEEVKISKAKEEPFDEDKLFDQVDLSDLPGNDVSEDIILDDRKQNTDEEAIPFQLKDDLSYLQAQTQRRIHPLISFSFIIILLSASFLQLTYFRSHELVKLAPAARPLLEDLCDTVPCHYSGPHDTKQIQLLSRDVRLHPKEKKALLISAAMINNADFAQPYPNIHVRLSDISGNVVAERIFDSKTYMGKLSSPFLLMKSKTPVHINFEVVDPGRDAVNFEFTFL